MRARIDTEVLTASAVVLCLERRKEVAQHIAALPKQYHEAVVISRMLSNRHFLK
jgi:hypothetical protein